MADLVTLVCQGTVSVLADGSPTCSGLWMLVQMPEPFNVETLDFAALGRAFATGFIVCTVPIVIGIAARHLLNFLEVKNHG